MSRSRRTADTRDLQLRYKARTHDGVIPVPFLGTTWQDRGSAYWRRRVGAVLIILFLFVLIGGMATGFTIGIIGGGHSLGRLVLGVVYDLTALAGVRIGLRQIAAAPLDVRTVAPRTVFPSGPLAFILAPLGAGMTLTLLVAMFRRDFIGERSAREAMERFEREGIVLTTPKPPHPQARH